MSDDHGRRGQKSGKLWRFALVAVIVMVFVGGWLMLRALTARPKPTADFAAQINARVVEAIVAADGKPPVPNQWDSVARIGTDLDAARAMIALEFPDPPEGWGDDTWPRDVFDVNPFTASEGTLARMRDVSNLPGIRAALERTVLLPEASGCRRLPTGGPLILVILPELSPIRTLARVMASQLELAVLDARWELAAAWYERTLALGRVMTTQPTLVDRIAGHAIISMANSRMLGTLAESAPDDAAVRAFEAALARQMGMDNEGRLTRIPPLALAIENERTFFLDTVQWCFTDDGGGDGRLIHTEMEALSQAGTGARPVSRLTNVAGSFVVGRKQTMEVANRYFDALIRSSKATVQQRRVMPPASLQVENQPPTQVFNRRMLPAFSSVERSSDQLHLLVIATRTILALERHRIRTGGYPRSLDQLVPEELAAIPADPFTSVGLIYRAEGSSYLLHSAGLDNQDDAGKQPAKEGERYFPLMREDSKGFDFVLGPPRKE